MSDISTNNSNSEQSQSKTIPMLEEELKAIQDKVAIIGNIASCARPYTSFDHFYFNTTLSSLEEMIADFTNGTQLVINRVKESRSEFSRITNKGQFLLSYMEVLSRLSALTEELEKIGVLISAYTSQYQNHA